MRLLLLPASAFANEPAFLSRELSTVFSSLAIRFKTLWIDALFSTFLKSFLHRLLIF
jgi:hypothetical protein